MHKIFCTGLLLVVVTVVNAQGIQFNNGSWRDMLGKAAAEQKLVFVDIYTSWCGPCKVMATKVFTQEKVGQKFNADFVPFMIDAEKGEGVQLAEKYAVDSYPTYLFIDSSGVLQYKIIGSMTADKLLAEAASALKKYKPVK